MKWYLLVMGIITVLMALIVWKASPAYAHEWYPDECCHERDCFHIRDGGVKRVDGGWFIVDSNEFIPDERTQETPGGIGGGFHRCSIDAVLTGRTIRGNVEGSPLLQRKPACFWAPKPDA